MERVRNLSRPPEHPLNHVMVWVGLSVLLPLLPIAVGIALHILQREPVSLFKLLDGIELLLIALWLITASAWDLSKLEFRWEKPLRLILICIAAIDLIFLILIYVHGRVRSLDLDTEAYLSVAIIYFVLAVIIAVTLQIYMSATVYYGFRGGVT